MSGDEFDHEWESGYNWGPDPALSSDTPPFTNYSGAQLIQSRLQDLRTEENGPHLIAFERDVKRDLIDEIQRTINWGDMNTTVTDSSDTFRFLTRIIVSKNDSFLRARFAEITPEDNEICLFLEDNTGDLVSGRSYYVAVGENFRLFLEEKYTEYASVNSSGFERIYENDEVDMRVSFSQEEIQELIETGRIENPYSATFYSTLSVLTFTMRWVGRLYRYVGDKILDATNFVKDHIKFKDKHWDPEAEENKGIEFQPILFHGSSGLFDVLSPENVDDATRILRQEITKFSDSVLHNIEALSEVDFSRISRRISGLNNVVELYQIASSKIVEIATSFVEILMAGVSEMVKFFLSFGERFISVLNAYYCGLWNSLVDAVIGIPEIVGYLFKGMGAIGHALDNAEVILPQALELFDEVLQSVGNIDLIGILGTLVSKIGGALSGIGSSIGLITLEKFYHFMGAVAGFIIENAVGFLLSAGVANAVSLLTKLGKFGKLAKIVVDIIMAANAGFEAAAASILEKIFAVIRWFFSILRKGGDGVATMIRSLMSAVRRGADIALETIMKFMRKLGLDPQDWDNLQRLGYDMIEIDDAGHALLRMNC